MRHIIAFRLSFEEQAMLADRVERQGTTRSMVIRDLIRARAERMGIYSPEPAPPEPIIAELPPTSVVYFAQAEHHREALIKIGTTLCLERRMQQLSSECGSPVRVLCTVPGGTYVEHDMHERFVAARVRGEWFWPSPELLAFIRSVSKS